MEQNVFEAGQQNFNLPHDIVSLPSGGIFYKSKKKSIKVGYLTASDENYLIGSSQSGRENIIMTLLRNKVYEHDLRPEELVEGDVEAILIYLRNTSFGPEYGVRLIDPKTNKVFEHTEILDEITIRQPKVQPDSDGLYTMILPRSGNTLKLRPLTFHDSLELERMADQYPVGRIAPKITWRLNKLIHSVDGNEDRNFISQFVETLPIVDSKEIRTFMRENQPSLDLSRRTIAPSGEEVIFDIAFGVEFFRPFF